MVRCRKIEGTARYSRCSAVCGAACVFRVREWHLTEAYFTYTARRVLFRGSVNTTGSEARSSVIREHCGCSWVRLRHVLCVIARVQLRRRRSRRWRRPVRAMHVPCVADRPLAPLPPHPEAHLPRRGSTRGQWFGRSAFKPLCSPAVVHGAVFPAVLTGYSTVVRAPPTC